jgi:hypothetical protein
MKAESSDTLHLPLTKCPASPWNTIQESIQVDTYFSRRRWMKYIAIDFPFSVSWIFGIFNMILLIGLFIRWLPAIPLFSRIADVQAQPALRLNTNNEFHITIFSDLHYGEEEGGWGIDQDVNSTRVMNDILDYENPDFVIISLCKSQNFFF